MKKIKFIALCAVLLTALATPGLSNDPCDGHVPIGTKCFVQVPTGETETKEDKEKSFFDSIFEFFFIF